MFQPATTCPWLHITESVFKWWKVYLKKEKYHFLIWICLDAWDVRICTSCYLNVKWKQTGFVCSFILSGPWTPKPSLWRSPLSQMPPFFRIHCTQCPSSGQDPALGTQCLLWSTRWVSMIDYWPTHGGVSLTPQCSSCASPYWMTGHERVNLYSF
jgi:hypothetical protein